MRRFSRIPFQALAAAALWALSSAASGAQPASPSASARIERVTGTVCRLDSQAGTFDLLTGVGHAFRIHRIRFAPDVRVTGRNAQAGIAVLVPGAVCRVECQPETAGPTATSIEVLEPAPARTP